MVTVAEEAIEGSCFFNMVLEFERCSVCVQHPNRAVRVRQCMSCTPQTPCGGRPTLFYTPHSVRA
ncbi:NACHT, LRR and PYD domains-containing protein 8 [Acetobacter orientalis]|uniref:NACHT, LRR and PYD domains-containing protein 8 n=1 Tax=Acetobacter orientalis TaxID=146474 RepID=A0A2Z5ZLF0_9PROT|nr:NACHT, LRR and PYD domains-containing protein 8 [Acetobacter orientalis]